MMPAKHLQSRCPVWALATPPLLSSLPAQLATDHNESHTHVLSTRAMLRWSVMLRIAAFGNAASTLHGGRQGSSMGVWMWLQLHTYRAGCRGRGNGYLRSSCFARWRCALASWRNCRR